MIELTVREAIVDALTAAGSRIYPLNMPQDATMPAVVYTRAGTTPINSLDGHSGKESARIQIDCYAKTYIGAKTLAGEIRSAMDTLKSVPINDFDLYEDEVQLYRVTLEFTVWN